jgi:large subunit ribosomal protein L10
MRAEKQLLLDELKEKIESSPGMIIASYNRLTPNLSWELRHLLAKSGGLFEVVRKRVFLKAAEQSGIKLDSTLFEGHIGVVFVEQTDVIAPLKVLYKFSEENQKMLSVLCGQLEGAVHGRSDMAILAQLPSLNEMRAQFVALLVSPMTQLLSVFESVMAEPLSILKQKSEENK